MTPIASLLLLAILPSLLLSAYADDYYIQTDKYSYDIGDVIILSGVTPVDITGMLARVTHLDTGNHFATAIDSVNGTISETLDTKWLHGQGEYEISTEIEPFISVKFYFTDELPYIPQAILLHTNSLLSQIDTWYDLIDRANNDISDLTILWDESLGNSPVKVESYESQIGDLLAHIEIYYTLIETLEQEISNYS